MPDLLPKIAEELSKIGYRKALTAIRSKQLRRGLVRKQLEANRWALHIPHFWAPYANKGRPAVKSTRPGGFLIWFRNPKDDPRLDNGMTPERVVQTRHLTKFGIQYWSKENQKKVREYKRRTGKRILTHSDYEAMQLPMVVVKMSPRSGAPVPGERFFENGPGGGMDGFAEEARQTVGDMTSKHVMETLRRAKLTGPGGSQLVKKVKVGL